MLERPNPRKGDVCGRSSELAQVGDGELVERVQRGQTEAYGELVRRYQDRVFNACWRICGHLEDARDLTQEAFLKAFEGLGSFRQQSGFYTWIFRVAVNLSLSPRRHVRGRRVRPNCMGPSHGRSTLWMTITAPWSCCGTLKGSITRRSRRFCRFHRG